ncbi:MAG: hypothetical protein AVDCRST_MAG88-2284, partial [uncultured Thermomicrobiales bacterium]
EGNDGRRPVRARARRVREPVPHRAGGRGGILRGAGWRALRRGGDPLRRARLGRRRAEPARPQPRRDRGAHRPRRRGPAAAHAHPLGDRPRLHAPGTGGAGDAPDDLRRPTSRGERADSHPRGARGARGAV